MSNVILFNFVIIRVLFISRFLVVEKEVWDYDDLRQVEKFYHVPRRYFMSVTSDRWFPLCETRQLCNESTLHYENLHESVSLIIEDLFLKETTYFNIFVPE